MKKKRLAATVLSMALSAASLTTPVFAQSGCGSQDSQQVILFSTGEEAKTVEEAERAVESAKKNYRDLWDWYMERIEVEPLMSKPYYEALNKANEIVYVIVRTAEEQLEELNHKEFSAWEQFRNSNSVEDYNAFAEIQRQKEIVEPFAIQYEDFAEYVRLDREGLPNCVLELIEAAVPVFEEYERSKTIWNDFREKYGDIYWEVTEDAWVDCIDATYNLFQAKNSYNTNESVDKVFSDIKANDWYRDTVQDVYNKGIMTGTDAAHFKPTRQLSRAEVATILWRIAGCPEQFLSMGSFKDVSGNEWYAKAAIWAKSCGIVTGYDDGSFGGAKPCTREQFVTMLYRFTWTMIGGKGFVPKTKTAYVKNYENEVWDNRSFEKFQDGAKVSEFALDAMGWAVANGIIKGKSNGEIVDPQGQMCRAECATVIARYTK